MAKPIQTSELVRFHDYLRFALPAHWRTRHRHDGFSEMIYIVRGGLRTQIAGRTLVGGPGDVLIYPRGQMHNPVANRPGTLEFLDLRWSGGGGLARLDQPDIRADRDGRIRHQLNWIEDLHPSQTAADRRILDVLTHTAIHEFGRLQNPAPGDLASHIRRFIRTNLTRRLTLDDLASEAGLSRYHFARRFRQVAGMTPMRLLSQMRIDAARSLIIRTDLKLQAIATAVGLADASHLSHLFRRIVGQPPASLRRPPAKPTGRAHRGPGRLA